MLQYICKFINNILVLGAPHPTGTIRGETEGEFNLNDFEQPCVCNLDNRNNGILNCPEGDLGFGSSMGILIILSSLEFYAVNQILIKTNNAGDARMGTIYTRYRWGDIWSPWIISNESSIRNIYSNYDLNNLGND